MGFHYWTFKTCAFGRWRFALEFFNLSPIKHQLSPATALSLCPVLAGRPDDGEQLHAGR